MKLIVNCRSCRGTGVYRGMAERNGFAVICHTCDGTGAEIIEYIPFTQRVVRDDVKTVGVANGFIRSSDPNEVTYEEFLNGKMPKDK